MSKKMAAVLGAVALTAAIVAIGAVAVAGPDGTEAAAPNTLTSAQRDEIRSATSQFQNVDVAIAAGYIPSPACQSNPTDPAQGAMGMHYVNPAFANDGIVDPKRPDALLFQPAADGKVKLAGVEYLKWDNDQNLGTDDDRPALFGEHKFAGPMNGHAPGMPIHFDLHAYVYTPNPSGELHEWNPAIVCPSPTSTTAPAA